MFLHVSAILFTGGGGGVGFPACITGHMTRGKGVCIQGRGLHPWWACVQGGFASRGRGVCIQGEGSLDPGGGGLHPGAWGPHPGDLCIYGGLHPEGRGLHRGGGSASRGRGPV